MTAPTFAGRFVFVVLGFMAVLVALHFHVIPGWVWTLLVIAFAAGLLWDAWRKGWRP